MSESGTASCDLPERPELTICEQNGGVGLWIRALISMQSRRLGLFLHSGVAHCARGSDCLSAHLTEPKPRKRIKAVCTEAETDGTLNTMSWTPPPPPAAPWERKVRISLSTPHESPSSFLSRFHPLIPVCCPNLTAIAQRAGAHAKGKLRPRCQSKHKNPVQSRQSESHMLMSCPLTQPSVFGLPV